MAKVKCTLPNASDEINGVKFSGKDGEKVSEDVSDEQAAAFTAIPGYEVVADAGDTSAAGGKSASGKK